MTIAIVLHLVADWIFNNDWMSRNKANLRHPAAWVHGLIHFIVMLLVFQWWVALIIAVTHMLIDTRKPLMWWRKFFKQTTEGEAAIHVAFWGDQVLHMAIIALAWTLVH